MATRRYSLVLVAAVVTALGATFGVWRVLDAMKAQSRITTRAVIVAARDIPEGGAIDRAAISVNEWPAATIPAGAFAEPDSVVGRVTRVAVFAGEPIVPGRLAPAGTGPGLEVKITPGKRAMALRIDDVAGVSGLLQPNSRVDVMITMLDASGARQVSRLFMENMRVLSVGTQVQRGEDGQPIQAASVALEVTPDEAERLAVAVSRGRIQLVLRGYGDPDSVRTKGTGDVFAQFNAPPAPAPAPRATPRPAAPRAVPPPPVAAPAAAPAPPVDDSWTVRVYRGGAASTVKVDKDSTKRP